MSDDIFADRGSESFFEAPQDHQSFFVGMLLLSPEHQDRVLDQVLRQDVSRRRLRDTGQIELSSASPLVLVEPGSQS